MFNAMAIMVVCTLAGVWLFNIIMRSTASKTLRSSEETSRNRSTVLVFVRKHDTILVKMAIILVILYGVGLFSSSYIEEEHQMWYFIVQTLWLGQVVVG